ncbi:MAG: hypothetical protein IT313_11910, partial [Anaerolineales bacterium]|nr:hypothetical protein [Anaerolineales bacterium]
MINRNRNFAGARIVLMIGLVTGLIGATPGSASADATKARAENSGFPVHVQTPSYPVGIASGDTKLVPFSINEAEGISGTITSRTYQFFTQYDVPLSESHGPFRANISINSNGTNGWSELVYLPKTVADKARAIKDYA